MQKIISGDTVYVHTGKDKGKTGTVLRVIKRPDPHTKEVRIKLIVDGINMAMKHMRGNPNLGTKSRREQIAKAIDYSNVAIFNSATQKPDKVKISVLTDGRKVRVFRSTGEEIANNSKRSRQASEQ